MRLSTTPFTFHHHHHFHPFPSPSLSIPISIPGPHVRHLSMLVSLITIPTFTKTPHDHLSLHRLPDLNAFYSHFRVRGIGATSNGRLAFALNHLEIFGYIQYTRTPSLQRQSVSQSHLHSERHRLASIGFVRHISIIR